MSWAASAGRSAAGPGRCSGRSAPAWGRALVEGRHLLEHNRDGMTPLQVEFVEQAAQADRARQRSRLSRQRRFTALVATLAVVATVAFGVTWYLRRQAVRQRQTAVTQA